MTPKAKKIAIVLSIVFAVVIIVLEIYFSLAPTRKVIQVQNLVYSDSTYYKKYSDYLDYPELFPQIKEISLIESQLDIITSDSIWILINAADKTISLKLKGVDLHKIPIENMKVDPFFYGLDPVSYRKIFSNPLKVCSESSTIVKDPMVVQKAPKDTIEAMQQLTLPDSIKYGPAFVTFNLDYGFKLIFKQSEQNKEEDKALRKQFDKDIYIERVKTNLQSLIKKDNQYSPTIEIELSTEEIHSFYRALPVNGNIILTF